METILKDLHSFNKALKSEKSELEIKVAELKQDLCIYQQGQSPQVAAATCTIPGLYETCPEEHVQRESLHSELNELVLADAGLPSPLCGTPGIIKFEIPASPSLDPNSTTEVMMRDFQQQRQEMQGRIETLLQQVSVLRENKGANGFSSDLMTEQLQSDMNSLLSSMTKVVEAKRSSDLRNAKLTDIIKKLRDSNSDITSKYKESQRLVETFASSEEELERVREENESLQMSIQRLKTQMNDLEIQLSRAKTELVTMKDEAHTLTNTLQTQMDHRESAEQQLQELKRSHSELEVKSSHNENLVKRLNSDLSTKEKQLLEEKRKNNELQNDFHVTKASHQTDLHLILDVILSDMRNNEEEEYDSQSPSCGTPSPVEEDVGILVRILDKQPSTELSAEQVRETVQKRLSDLHSQLASSTKQTSDPTSESSAAKRRLDVGETGLAAAQRAASVMAESYGRPNMLMEHGKDEQNNNEDKRERSTSLTNTRKTLHRIGRRHSDQEYQGDLTSEGSNDQLIDLVNDKLEEVKMSPEDQHFSSQLLVDARKASERFNNRRGRRWSSESSMSSNGERSPPHSGGSSPRDRSPESEHRTSLSEISTAPPSKTNGHGSSLGMSETAETASHVSSSDLQHKEFTSENGGVHVEERTGAEGESDTEENTSPSCNRRLKPRSDSDVDEIDIKADILKNIGPIQTDGGQNKSKEPLTKRREEQKIKRNVSFKMPQLPEAQEVNGVRETVTNSATSDTDSASEDTNDVAVNQTSLQENGTTENPRLRKQDEIEIDSPPRLVSNSILQALGLTNR
ncbi:uncharacterized protein [Amphiura filiformis]|uniref:uncharacterized protein n=1 Tax=Amphiura filiformis TaxID=82378 RepID=UPI003B224A70